MQVIACQVLTFEQFIFGSWKNKPPSSKNDSKN